MKISLPKLPSPLPHLSDSQNNLHADEGLRSVEAPFCEILDAHIPSAEIDSCLLRNADFTGAHLEKVSVNNTVYEKSVFDACDFTDSGWLQTSIVDTRCYGVQFQLSTLKHVTFRNCQLSLANFRYAKLTNVQLEDCVIVDADFHGAQLVNVSFVNCSLDNCTFSDTTLRRVDFTESRIGTIHGISRMKGIIINSSQLVSLAPFMAHELGITVED